MVIDAFPHRGRGWIDRSRDMGPATNCTNSVNGISQHPPGSGEHIVIIADHTTQIPSELDRCVKYSMEEVQILGQKGMPSPEKLREVHMVKQEFEGTVVDQPVLR